MPTVFQGPHADGMSFPMSSEDARILLSLPFLMLFPMWNVTHPHPFSMKCLPVLYSLSQSLLLSFKNILANRFKNQEFIEFLIRIKTLLVLEQEEIQNIRKVHALTHSQTG